MRRAAVALLALTLVLSACGRNMADQPNLRPLQSSEFFQDGLGMRDPVPGTVSRRMGAMEPALLTGIGAGGFVQELPVPLTMELLQRGRERYDVYCSVCHGYTGRGDGMIITRGFPQPTSFHDPRLLDAGVGYTFHAITNGFGRMYSYASRIPVEDRWAIAAYVKALQLSQNASLDDLPADVRSRLLPSEGRNR